MEEQIELLRRLWQEPVAQLRGPLPHDHGGRDQPAPGAAADPDLDGRLLGPGARADRAARRRVLPAVEPARGAAGPPRSSACATGGASAGRDPTTSGSRRGSTPPTGRPTTGTGQAEEWRALGATHLSIATMRGGLAGSRRPHRPARRGLRRDRALSRAGTSRAGGLRLEPQAASNGQLLPRVSRTVFVADFPLLAVERDEQPRRPQNAERTRSPSRVRPSDRRRLSAAQRAAASAAKPRRTPPAGSARTDGARRAPA